MLDEVSKVIDAQLCDLKSNAMDELRKFVDQPRRWKLQIEGKTVDFGIWAKLHEDDRLAVIVEGRRNFILGMSRVVADGFYLAMDGAVATFDQRDLWDHGY